MSDYRGMTMNQVEMLKKAMKKQKITQTVLAERTNQAQRNLSNKFIRNNFRISEFEQLVAALGCKLEITIVMPDGERL